MPKIFFTRTIILLGALLAIMIYIGPFVLFMNWSFKVNEYCQKKAEVIVGSRWNETLLPNEEEKKQFPDLDEISYGFREQLKCEHDPQTLEKFKGWF